ncbi:K02A2.6-like [Cordylochernes scorpioides]|uniref:K02A2.6-like n=1 Tax=Cordylochernes scorpioides TaxID=51811 RepID=A0ABY6LJ86_9ARAC|nr:K02A2.6-like [Cordylochernes scorpioides]
MSHKQRNVEHAMTPNPNTIEIPKFNGQNLDITSWLKFFNKKCLQKHLDEDFKLNNISNYLEGEAFSYYIEELQDIYNWGEIEQKLTSYFTIKDSNLFSRFLNLKYNDKDDLEQYFKEKSALAKKLNLEKTLLLEALTDGMPDHLKKYLIAARVQEPSEWYKITTQLKLSTNKEEEPQQPSTSTSTPVKKFNSNSSKAHQYQPFSRTAAATHHQQEPYKSINQPQYPCKICASHQLPNQIHFHRDCPLKNNNHPKRTNPDASSLGVAGVLKQPDEQGILHPIGYFSRKLHPYEQNYTASEIETLAIINSVQRFHTYLHNIHFTLHTDHLPLKWIKNVKNPQETNAKVERLNSTIINRLRCEYNANLKIPWTKYIPKITESYNETVHTTTGFTPKFLYYGIQPQYIEHCTVTHTPIEKARKLAIERTIKSHEHSKQLYDIKHPEPIFKEGDQRHIDLIMSDDDRDIESDDDEVSLSPNAEESRNGSNLFVNQVDKRAHHNALERKRRDHIKSKRPRRIALHQRPHLQEMEGGRGTTKTRIQRRASLQCQPCIQDMEGQSRYLEVEMPEVNSLVDWVTVEHCLEESKVDSLVGWVTVEHCLEESQVDTLFGWVTGEHWLKESQVDSLESQVDTLFGWVTVEHCLEESQVDSLVDWVTVEHCLEESQLDSLVGRVTAEYCLEESKVDSLVGWVTVEHCLEESRVDSLVGWVTVEHCLEESRLDSQVDWVTVEHWLEESQLDYLVDWVTVEDCLEESQVDYQVDWVTVEYCLKESHVDSLVDWLEESQVEYLVDWVTVEHCLEESQLDYLVTVEHCLEESQVDYLVDWVTVEHCLEESEVNSLVCWVTVEHCLEESQVDSLFGWVTVEHCLEKSKVDSLVGWVTVEHCLEESQVDYLVDWVTVEHCLEK